MEPASTRKKTRPIPKKFAKHYSYDENVNEPSQLIEDEAVDIEASVPAEENEPVETIDQDEERISSVFEE